jgi:hypothetical protein
MRVTVRGARALMLAAAAAMAAPAAAQGGTSDLAQPAPAPGAGGGQPETMGDQATPPPPPAGEVATPPATAASQAPDTQTYQQDDVLGAAEGVFGKGAEGLAHLLERILKDQGRPTAYIAGREASAAFAVGLRYGSGVLHHKIEGDRPVYWTGPSLGFDIGGNAAKTFVLVYNLYDTQDLYHRFPAAEGTAYLVGGFTASYLRRGDIVLIPIRLGVGWRLGANVGYMKFSPESRWLPF